jgi:hypothetical protein
LKPGLHDFFSGFLALGLAANELKYRDTRGGRYLNTGHPASRFSRFNFSLHRSRMRPNFGVSFLHLLLSLCYFFQNFSSQFRLENGGRYETGSGRYPVPSHQTLSTQARDAMMTPPRDTNPPPPPGHGFIECAATATEPPRGHSIARIRNRRRRRPAS